MTTQELAKNPQQKIDTEKQRIKETILSATAIICSGNSETCKLPRCCFAGSCELVKYKNGDFPRGRKGLKSLLANISKNVARSKGRQNPTNHGQNVHEIASTFLGCDIYEHELVKPFPKIADQIKEATTLNGILLILDRVHFVVNGKSLLWHYKNKYRNR